MFLWALLSPSQRVILTRHNHSFSNTHVVTLTLSLSLFLHDYGIIGKGITRAKRNSVKRKKQENLTDPDTNLRYRKFPSTRRENHKQQLPNRLPIFKFNTGRHVRYRTPVTLWKALRIVRPARWSCPEIKYERCSKASVTTQAARSTICCSNFTGSILRSRKKGNILLKKKNKRKTRLSFGSYCRSWQYDYHIFASTYLSLAHSLPCLSLLFSLLHSDFFNFLAINGNDRVHRADVLAFRVRFALRDTGCRDAYMRFRVHRQDSSVCVFYRFPQLWTTRKKRSFKVNGRNKHNVSMINGQTSFNPTTPTSLPIAVT